MPDGGGAHWNTTGYHGRQQSQGYAASPSASSTNSSNQQQQQQHAFQGLPQPVLQKRPSTSQMQGIVYHGATNSASSQPGSPGGYASHSTMSPIPPSSSAGQHAHLGQHHQQYSHSGGMALSPGMRSNPQASPGTSSFAYDQSRMSFSPVVPTGQQQQHQQQQYYSAPSTSSNSNTRNLGLGVTSGSHQSGQYAGSPAGPSSPFGVADQRHQQQQHMTRPTNLSGQNASSYGNANTSTNPQRQFNRSNSSASGALSISTSPTTAGQASPMTPSSPAALSTSTARGSAFQHQQQSQQQQQPQQQYSYQPNASNSYAASSSLNSMSPLDQQLRRPSLQQTPSSLSSYTSAAQTPDQAHAQAQYAAYLEDPMSGFDRRIGSYSPSRYAVGDGASNALPGQFAPSSYQQQQQAPGTLPSPRHAQNNPYFSPATSTNPIPLPQSFQQQQQRTQSVSLSPSYSRQGQQQQVASTSMQHAPSSSTSSNAYSPAPQQATSSAMKPMHSRSGSYPSPQTSTHTLIKQRPRSTGSAFRQVRNASDLKPSQSRNDGHRRADPDGGVVSVSRNFSRTSILSYTNISPYTF